MAPLDTKPSGAPKGVWKSGKGKGRHTPKGRQFTDEAQAEIQRLLGDRPRRRDLLIEFLHLIQDKHGGLSSAHLRALAEEMRLSQAEVYEVATFYAHFDVVKEGETPPPDLTKAGDKSDEQVYEHFRMEFARLAGQLEGHARRKELEASAYIQQNLTATCIACHEYIRDFHD